MEDKSPKPRLLSQITSSLATNVLLLKSKHDDEELKVSLSVWRPVIKDDNRFPTAIIMDNDDSKEEEDTFDSDSYMIGYLALNYVIDPTDIIPMILLKNGSDACALVEPKKLCVYFCTFVYLMCI